MSYEGVLLAGLAASYFLATFGFAGYVLKIYVERRDAQVSLATRLDRFQRLEARLEAATSEALAHVSQGGFPPAE